MFRKEGGLGSKRGRHKVSFRSETLSAFIAPQDGLHAVAGDVAAFQALAVKALQIAIFGCAWVTGSHPGGRRFESD